MADHIVTSTTYEVVQTPSNGNSRMQVHDAPVRVTFGTDLTTKGLVLLPGDVIEIAPTDTLRAMRMGRLRSAILSFEVFGQ